ncbi:MAG: hypothetical protein IJQ56_02090, partial [Synergistaceae bacterium]|nr:hypothetical protein [Synergistaceae bacterium]
MDERFNNSRRDKRPRYSIDSNDPDSVLFGAHPRVKARKQAEARAEAQQIREKAERTEAPRKPQSKPKKRKKSFSVLKILFMTILLVVLLATGAVSAGVAWYVVKLSEDLPS